MLCSYMFIRFFINNYVKQAQGSPPPSKIDNVRQSGRKAGKDLRKELEEAMASEQDGLETDRSDLPSQVADQSEKINKGAKDVSRKGRNAASNAADHVRDGAHQANDALHDKDIGKKAKNAASDAADRIRDGAHQANDVLQEKGQQATDALSEKVNEMNKKAKGTREPASEPKDTKATEGSKEQAKPSKSSSDDTSKQDMDKVPKLESTSSSDSANKPKSRSVSPHKRTQLPQPSSKNRANSPDKRDQGPKEKEQPRTNGDVGSKEGSNDGPRGGSAGEKDGDEEEKPSSLDESAYEVNPDELENEEERKAQAEMQPKSS